MLRTLDTGDEMLRTIAVMQQRARALEHEAGLRQREEEFRLLVENVQDYAIVLLDTEGRIITWNPGAERIKGYRASEIIGRHFAIFYSREEVEAGKPLRGLQIAAADGRFRDDGWRVRKDGSQFWASVVITALHDGGGNLRGFAKITHDRTNQKQHEKALRDLSGQLLSLQDEERRTLARELHDSTAQVLAALSLSLARIGRLNGFAEDPHASQVLAETSALASQAIQEIRAISCALHPPMLDELGLAHAVRWFVRRFTERTQIRVDLEIPPKLGRFPREIEIALFRIAEESLTNVHCHSGSSTASVRLERPPDQIFLEIRDQGSGLPERILQSWNSSPAAPGVGIRGMNERVRQLGGRMEIRNGQPGTIVEVSLPLHPLLAVDGQGG